VNHGSKSGFLSDLLARESLIKEQAATRFNDFVESLDVARGENGSPLDTPLNLFSSIKWTSFLKLITCFEILVYFIELNSSQVILRSQVYTPRCSGWQTPCSSTKIQTKPSLGPMNKKVKGFKMKTIYQQITV
jgi:hypothetical protein